ncbi:MAG: UDP-N-acetylmuramoyl-tripeptide--D-alanyl-D-alanine ligase [Xanthomonadales bacterium PRO7]|jgi:UDP-N-acetylmuramoyl-tripeptide--D-alanyl-D-alanine ligase|nr:UDP-N-acetylmuramoyl-tripeptide--D-alanyl-D-alanine ligase [Xanthomonadales bacterium PRO7]HMM57471.1 UDP-N-acetylmuramoyl-tripeptide--D-alanyl-D-alanine ligase [Rudaea sp.]
MNLRLGDVALWTRGARHGADTAVDGVFTDTRKPVAGGLFIALKGEHFDAHEFVGQAKQGGAAAALVAHPVAVDLPQVVVADTLLALGDLASAIRAQRRARVAGITGSNGKTTVKTLLASILAQCGKTHVNAGNLNNEIGLPLSILSMPEDCEYAVLEMGAGKPGDIEYLAAIARPEIALVNNVASAHLERMGSLEGIAQTKGAIYAALPVHGVAIVNADDAFAAYFAGVAGTRHVLSFGLEHEADVRAKIHGIGVSSQITVLAPAGRVDVNLPLPGRHNVMNALAAATLALAFDAPLTAIQQGLETAAPVAGRLIRHAMPGGWSLIDDSYNANPGSTAAAIATLAIETGETWLVLGDMRELGKDAEKLHAQIGALARQSGIVHLYTVGELSAHAAKAFGPAARHFGSQKELAAALAGAVRAGAVVLVKGSRGSAMERVVQALRAGANGNHGGARHAA